MKPVGTLLVSALADTDHGHGNRISPGPRGAPAMGMPGMEAAAHGMMPRMQTMMRMHGGMRDAGMGMGAPDELRSRLLALLAKHDADADGSLSLEEFATLHAALTREMVVDRFQFLDEDGDGAVTAAEIDKPARLMDRRQAKRAMHAGSAMRPPGQETGSMRDHGGMMQGNRVRRVSAPACRRAGPDTARNRNRKGPRHELHP